MMTLAIVFASYFVAGALMGAVFIRWPAVYRWISWPDTPQKISSRMEDVFLWVLTGGMMLVPLLFYVLLIRPLCWVALKAAGGDR